MTVVRAEVATSATVDDSVVGLVAHDDPAAGPAIHDDAAAVGSAAHVDAGFAAAEVQRARRALEVLARRVASGATSAGSRAEWAGLVTACQSLANTATAVQDVAITRLAAIEEEWLEDGTVVETHRAPGHVALDAPDIVAGALGVSHVHAQRRVGLAVRLVADSDVGGADAGAKSAVGATGLSALHAAMVEGDLDAYRAAVVAEELTEAPPEVADAVVGVLVPYVDVETAVQLRRRCRRALARISPDLLRQRAKRAREACGLRRWVDEPGVDRWEGTFPSEQAAEGWAAVDALARRYVTENRCQRIETARAQALMDLIRAQATIDVQLVVTVPATSTQRLAAPPEPSECSRSRQPMQRLAPTRSAEDLVEVVGLVPGEPVLVHRGWVESAQEAGAVGLTQCHPCSGALLDRATTAATSYRPSARLAALVRARDGRCRFPGCSVAARFCDLDHVRPWPAGPTTATNLMCLCRRHHRIKQRPGWSVRLLPDARAKWSDPTGRIRVSHPRDLLDLVVLPANPAGPEPELLPTPESTPSPPSESVTQLEVLLGVLGDHGPDRRPDGGRGPRRGRRVHRVPPLPGCRVRYVDGRADHAPRTHRRRSPAEPGVLRETGPPPF